MPLYKRPNYTRRVLEALSECDGINEYTILFSIDGNDKEIKKIVENFCLCNKIFHKGPNKGCNANCIQAFNKGFELANFIIYIEDDTVLATDALRFLEWGDSQFRENDNVTTVCAYHRNPTVETDCEKVTARKGFCCWGIGMWKDRFSKIKFDKSSVAWDTQINRQKNKQYTIQPLVGRCQNIGAENGTYVRCKKWHAQNHHTPYWIMNHPERKTSYNYYLDKKYQGEITND